MLPFNILKLVIAGVLCFIIYNIYSNTYEQQIVKIRKNKDHYFRTSINSPIQKKEQFEGLSYFEPDAKYKIAASFRPLKEEEEMEILSSDGRKLKYTKHGIASFILNGRDYNLVLFKNASSKDKMLFLPFTDKTNGEQTYLGGRYLDVEYSGKETVIIDFNQAYHPYCMYNYKYSCPIPPADNYLGMDIRAGEKLSDTLAH